MTNEDSKGTPLESQDDTSSNASQENTDIHYSPSGSSTSANSRQVDNIDEDMNYSPSGSSTNMNPRAVKYTEKNKSFSEKVSGKATNVITNIKSNVTVPNIKAGIKTMGKNVLDNFNKEESKKQPKKDKEDKDDKKKTKFSGGVGKMGIPSVFKSMDKEAGKSKGVKYADVFGSASKDIVKQKGDPLKFMGGTRVKIPQEKRPKIPDFKVRKAKEIEYGSINVFENMKPSKTNPIDKMTGGGKGFKPKSLKAEKFKIPTMTNTSNVFKKINKKGGLF